MPVPSRIIKATEVGGAPDIYMEPDEVNFYEIDYREWLADRYTASSPTIPDPTASFVFTPSGGAPTVANITRTAYTIRFKLTAPAAPYEGVLRLNATLNSALATQEIHRQKLAIHVINST